MSGDGSPEATPQLQRVRSEGGLSLLLPEGWSTLHSEEHLAVFVGAEPTMITDAFAPNCVVTELATELTLATWWEELQPQAEGPLLLEAGQDDSGFAATFAQVADGISVTGFTRAFLVPGRTVTITVQFATSEVARLLPLAARIADSLDVEGLT